MFDVLDTPAPVIPSAAPIRELLEARAAKLRELAALERDIIEARMNSGRRPGDGSDQLELFSTGQPTLFGG